MERQVGRDQRLAGAALAAADRPNLRPAARRFARDIHHGDPPAPAGTPFGARPGAGRISARSSMYDAVESRARGIFLTSLQAISKSWQVTSEPAKIITTARRVQNAD